MASGETPSHIMATTEGPHEQLQQSASTGPHGIIVLMPAQEQSTGEVQSLDSNASKIKLAHKRSSAYVEEQDGMSASLRMGRNWEGKVK